MRKIEPRDPMGWQYQHGAGHLDATGDAEKQIHYLSPPRIAELKGEDEERCPHCKEHLLDCECVTCERCDKIMDDDDWWCDEPICENCRDSARDAAMDRMKDFE